MRLINPDTTHWYTRDGQPMHTVLDRHGNERPTDLRDARKLDLLPSVTNVLNVIAKDTLTQWKIEQAVLAALTLPRTEGEDLDSFARRVVEDGQARTRTAAEFGTLFHAGAERVAQNPLCLSLEEPLYPWLLQYRDWFQTNCERLIWTERVLVSNEHGFAGTADLCMVHRTHGLCLVDLKTQGVKPGALPRKYPSWLYQLAAYASVLGEPVTCLNLVANSTAPDILGEFVWDKEQVALGWEVFQAAHLIWRNEKNYNPIRVGTTSASSLNPKSEARNPKQIEICK